MQIEYWINDNGWKQVDHNMYDAFIGEKEHRPSTWRLMLMQSILQKYRYM
jgi:hypothetical protein